MQRVAAQAPMRRGLLLSLARDARASDWFLSINSEQRSSLKGRYGELSIAAHQRHPLP